MGNLPRQNVERMGDYVKAYQSLMARRQALLEMDVSVVFGSQPAPASIEGATAEAGDGEHWWLREWKSLPELRDAQASEMDDLANVFGNW